MAIANEKELSSMTMTDFPPARKVLVVAPHPDDEVFGCGGTLALLRSGGSVVTIIIVTDGALGGDNADRKLIESRAEESRAAVKLLGLDEPVFWGLPDRGVDYGEVLIKRLSDEILETEADLVFLPSPVDWHPDHQAIAFAGAEAIRRLGGKRQVAFYEVSDPLPSPNLVHDISLVEEKKFQAMRCFHSQLREQPYDTRISGINNFRALHLGAQVKSAEAFTLLAAADLDKGLPILLDGPLAYRRSFGFAVTGSDMPLVSVIIRSMDRSTLMEALNSLALQTYSNIEVLLVNAKGSEHQKIDQWCRRFPVRIIDDGKRLSRSRAANMGLDAAHGEYLMFLDDDDWIEADHIQKLVAAIRQHPEFKVVYTGVKCVDERKNLLTSKFDTPFDAAQMVAQNFIPIHAVLFSRSLLELGCRLDESLEFYEDWDFWIQVSGYGDFLKTEGLSAVYRITPQAGFGVNMDPALAVPARWAIYKKWLNRLGDRQITGLMETVQLNPIKDGQISCLNQTLVERDGQIASLNQTIVEREGRIANLNQVIAEREGQIANLNQAVAEREGQIANLNQAIAEREGQVANLNQAVAERDSNIRRLLASKSWLVTKPLRWAGRIVRGDFPAALDPFKRLFKSSLLPLRLFKPVVASEPQHCASTRTALVQISPIEPTHHVAVILPVYRGVEMTKRCILAAIPGVLNVPHARFLAINDASPDEGMQAMLEDMALQWPNIFSVLKNERNLGFVGTVNRGLAYFAQQDVVLLNSDVIVPQDWLQRLVDEAYSNPKVGTVTPFSNNATICSFPQFLQENEQPFNLGIDSVDAVFRQSKLPCIEAPTGVGFCMYVRRSCLDEIGYLDEEKFGRGYGEENDLCQRALKRGWLNIISPNIYAYHEGGVSFSSDKQALVDRAMGVIDALHPNYHADIQSFIKEDPVKSARITRYIQLLSTSPVPKVLHISHAMGGGVLQHIDDLAQNFAQSIAHILLVPHGTEDGVRISLGVDRHADKLVFAIPSGYADLVSLLKAIGVSAVHFHHTQGLDSKILGLPADLDVACLFTAHDYYWLNANPTLTDVNGKFPGFYSDTQHNPLYPLPQGMTLANWQEMLRPLIESADCVIFPSNATKTLFDNTYSPANPVVAPHIELQLDLNRTPGLFTKKPNYIIGALGALGREKGADLLEKIAATARNADSPLKFKLIGYAYRSLQLVETTGPYKNELLASLIQEHKLDIVFFPAQCPETYSYTLSYALDSGLPIIAPNIGAFPERLSGRPNTLIFNHLISEAELFNQLEGFIEKLSKGVPVIAPIFEGDKSNPDFYVCDYIEIVSRELRIIDSDKTVPFGFDSAQIMNGVTDSKATWRESLLRGLWYLYMNPSARWISHAIPYSVRRFVKRSLSRSPIHDIAQGSRGR